MKKTQTGRPYRGRATITKNVISLLLGALMTVTLGIAVFAVPAVPGTPGHYNSGNSLVAALFFSYAMVLPGLTAIAAFTMYIVYAFAAMYRARKLGVWLWLLHYGLAFGAVMPFELYRNPQLPAASRIQFDRLVAQPGVLAFCVLPFIVANVVFLWRVLGPRASKHAADISASPP